MADRRVKLILEAQVDQFNSNLRKARGEADDFGNKLRSAINQPEMQQLGRHLTAFGTLTVGALGMATKAAIDWETAWTDVMRRTDGTPQQLNELEGPCGASLRSCRRRTRKSPPWPPRPPSWA
ncbi:hypothetical protein [Nesterenkonia pannonica]|uniref:hypothetical protein n=1 Tax=Nesterenkonia pannonica TaxID=1548602 RepID=UPI002164285F|nr:hypothetical protein [Nesterenkonia pannonica]